MSSADTIYSTVRAAGFPVALSSFIVAQARFETGNFTSSVFKSCNNAFGYKAVGSAPKCTGSPEGDYYRKYASVQESASEIVGWIKRRQKEGKFPADLNSIRTVSQYTSLLKNSGYFGDTLANYTAGVTRYYNQYKTPSGGSTGLIVIALLLTSMWIIKH